MPTVATASTTSAASSIGATTSVGKGSMLVGVVRAMGLLLSVVMLVL